MLNNQRISSFTNLKWANLEMIHPYHHLSLSIFQSAWPQIYPATRQESAKNPWGRLIGSWLEIELVFLWKTSGYLLPNAKVAIEKAGLGSFICEILWNEENSESKGHVWNPDQHIEFHIIMLIYVYHCLSIFIYVTWLMLFVQFSETHLSHYFMLSLPRPKCWLYMCFYDI